MISQHWIEIWRHAAHAGDRTHIADLAMLAESVAREPALAEMWAYANGVMTPALADNIVEERVWSMARRRSTRIELAVTDPTTGAQRHAQALTLDLSRWGKPWSDHAQLVSLMGSTAHTADAIDVIWSRRVVAKVEELWAHPDWPQVRHAHASHKGIEQDRAQMLAHAKEGISAVVHRAGEAIFAQWIGSADERDQWAAEFRRWAQEERLRCWLMVRLNMRPHAAFIAQVGEEVDRHRAMALMRVARALEQPGKPTTTVTMSLDGRVVPALGASMAAVIKSSR